MSALADVQLRDGRFVMLPVQRIHAARDAIGGLRRQRALWLVGCLQLLADQQRHELGGSTARASRAQLCAMTGLSSSTLTKITHALIGADVLDVQRPVGPMGPLPSVYRLAGDPAGPRILITHPTLRVMRSQIADGPLTGAFATYVTIADLINEKRGERVVASRQEIARRVGVSSPRSLDEYVAALQAAGLLCKHSVCDHRGQQPITWELTEPSATARAVAQTADRPVARAAQPANGARATCEPTPCNSQTDPVQAEHGPGADDDQTPCSLSANPGADCAGPAPSTAAPIARAGQLRQDKRRQDTVDIPIVVDDVAQGRGEDICADIEALCEHLAASLARRATPAILSRPGGWYMAPDLWREHAAAVLRDVDLERARRAVDYLAGDTILGSQIRTMKALADRLDEVLLRVAAADVRAQGSARSQMKPEDGAPQWAEAQQRVQAAIRRHGTNRAAAAGELALEHPAYAPFIELVGWTNLCRDDPQRRQWDWQQAWKQACRSPTANDPTEEAA
ncbi:MAG: hypothetical protein M3N04_07680 [Actinomycetota bacterium]|nr:hypothetical protein [Actinomycetota bacterium]